jgi:outer membrane protein assembly factor BamB
MTFRMRMLTAIIVLAGLSATIDGQNRGPDWTQWRGQNRDGAVTGFSTPQSWPENLVQKWKVDVGLGYASPIVVGNRLYMFSRQGGDEVMSGLDVDTGKVVWRTGYPVTFTMHSAAVKHGMGPGFFPLA